MKKSYLYLPLLSLLMVGCANEDSIINSENRLPGAAPTDFLTINLVPTHGATRDGDPVPVYEDGTPDESKVTTVRFFFFDDEDNAFPVWENRSMAEGDKVFYNSYLDWYPNSSDIQGDVVNSSSSVETILHTTLGIITPGTTKPSSVLAVINPDAGVLGLNSPSTNEGVQVLGPSLSELQAKVSDYYTNLHGNNFVMSNSVYVVPGVGTAENTLITATALTEDNFVTNPDGHDFDPEKEAGTNVEIYVERVLARVDFGISTAMNGIKITPTTDEPAQTDEEGNDDGSYYIYSTGDPYMVDNESTEIYVRFLGWNVTATSDKSRLIKNVNKDWQSTQIFGTASKELWNSSDYHRSFWGMNPDGITYQYGTFDGTENAKAKDVNYNPATREIVKAGDFSIAYLQENANGYNESLKPMAPNDTTKVIIAAQLCKKDGTPITLTEWNYHKYEGTNMLTYLANNELSQLYYYDSTSDAGSDYEKIEPTDLTYATAQQLGLETEDPDYFVYVVLTTAATDKQWYLKGIDGELVAYEDSQEVNDYIFNKVNRVRVWNEGRTYYYFDIKHLGDEGSVGYYGIVRNHIYRSTVKSVQGLGTPVYDPGQIIIPEQNVYDESIVNADVKVLQWRVVANEYELKWK